MTEEESSLATPLEPADALVSLSRPKVEVAAEQRSLDFPVVGIGASAGGLAAFEAFFSGMPAQPRPRLPRRTAPPPRAGAAARPASPHRLLLPLSRAGPARAGHRHRSLGDRQRRHARPAGDQGRGRRSARPNARLRRLRRHAAQRDRDGPRRLRVASQGDAGAAPCICGARLQQGAAPGSGPDARQGRHAEEDLHRAARRGRARLPALQAEHRRPARRAADGRQPDRDHGGLPALLAQHAQGGAGPVSRSAHRRHQLLPRRGRVRCPRGASDPAAVRGEAGQPRGAGLGVRMRHRRGGLLDRDAGKW